VITLNGFHCVVPKGVKNGCGVKKFSNIPSHYGPAKLRFFKVAEQYETGQFLEGYKTQFPKRFSNLEVRILAKGPKTREILVEAKKYSFRVGYKTQFPKQFGNFVIFLGPKTRKILVKAERFKLS
jgi:hypothetical protein